MSGQNKLTIERNQRTVLELAQKPGNDICADCKARNPRWASHNLGIFICVNCASIHRKIGTHITKVKSLTMDTWTKEQVEVMKNMGNANSNAIYNPNEARYPPPPNLEDSERDSELEQYIRGKYEYKRFFDRSALVASKLGPSRSASSATPRSASSPLTNSNSAGPSRSNTVPVPKPPTTPIPATTPSSSTPILKPPLPSLQPYAAPQPIAITPIQHSPSQSMPAGSMQQPAHTQNIPQGGVWNDLVSLQTSTAPGSSLPLQYQPQQQPSQQFSGVALQGMQSSSFTPTGGYQTGFQQPQFASSTYSLQPQSAYTSSAQFTNAPQQQQQTYGQQMFSNQSQTPMTSQAQFFQPQPQSSLQIQVPQNGGYMTPSPQPFMSAPVQQTHFLTPSPAQQFMSHSPQPQIQMQQGQFMSNSPQPIGMMGSANGSPQIQQTQFMQAMMPQQQQQQHQFVPQQMMQQSQLGGGFQGQGQGQGYAQGGYPSQQQWGTM
ncbi:hypothetical protein BDQ12DRAFT_693023 [Crucibulum laeve]|uniref:Arf-GAP domain-containing protein n=1 Tax=Crucibulum laeve TaxID=68775 RepID=A0A5C3LGU8_9AGAR|nr:hypothetical protein BDQ12DRAFT_693023 [Crucibulum laeve]